MSCVSIGILPKPHGSFQFFFTENDTIHTDPLKESVKMHALRAPMVDPLKYKMIWNTLKTPKTVKKILKNEVYTLIMHYNP